MAANGDAAGIEVKAIQLAGLSIQTGDHPTKPGEKAILIGPLFLCIPLDPAAAKTVVRGLTGVQIAGVDEVIL